ncbi:MAG TPA: hypothetical protein VGE17_02845 [Methylophilus sp.]
MKKQRRNADLPVAKKVKAKLPQSIYRDKTPLAACRLQLSEVGPFVVVFVATDLVC